MQEIKIRKKSQAERLTEAEVLISNIWDEVRYGIVEHNILQTAVYVQTDINRLVWKLNEIMNGKKEILKCKDCKYWQRDWEPESHEGHYCELNDIFKRDEFFCADAERRDDES